MLRSKATLLVTTAALAAMISGGIAAANADTGGGATSTEGTTGASGATGTTGTTGATGPAATITINGAGFANVDPNAPTATMQSDYLGALESALGDAHTKAVAIAAAAGEALGAVQNITEQSTDSEGCSGPVAFSVAGSASHAPSAAGPPAKKHRRHHKAPKATARIADESTSSCGLEADVTVTYALLPASSAESGRVEGVRSAPRAGGKVRFVVPAA